MRRREELIRCLTRVGRDRECFASGGTLPAHAASYIERSTDGALFEALRAGRFCYVHCSRQIGESSLSIRTIDRLREAGVRTAFVDHLLERKRIRHLGAAADRRRWRLI